MDPSPVPSIEEDEWDTDGFVIPSLGIADSDQTKPSSPEVENPSISVQPEKEEEHIYLGPHGAPPSLSQQQEPNQNQSNRKQKFKHKLKDADRKFSGTGRENKVDHLRELVGGKMTVEPSKGSPREWLDPHCHESEFEKRRF